MSNKGFKQSFEGGMDQDTSAFKYQPNKYYSATNYRLTVDKSSNTYNLTTIGGLSTEFKISASTGTNQYSYRGHTFVRDELVLFVVDTIANTDYILLIDPEDIDFSSGTELDVSTETIYSGSLGFEDASHVSAVGSYESSTNKKVYFAVPDEPLRGISLSDGDLTSTYSEEDLQAVIPAYMYGAEVTDILLSGNLKAGKVQYTYSLINTNGVESLYAPLSELVTITEGNPKSASSYLTIEGGEEEASVGKSLQVTIDTSDANANAIERIKVVGIYYEDLSVNPTIKVIGEFSYTSNLIIVDSGGGHVSDITVEELIASRALFEAITLETKNNYLFAANITERSLEIDYDARAYRFNSGGVARTDNDDGTFYYIYDNGATLVSTGGGLAPYHGYWQHLQSDGVTVITASASSSTAWGIPETADAVTPDADPNNDFAGSDYTSGYDRHSGSDILKGGRGLNIDYFIEPDGDAILENARFDDWDYVPTGSNTISGYDSTHGIYSMYQYSPSGNTMRLDTATTFMRDTVDNYASPFRASYHLSFRRDEIYRIGIVFFDKYGRSSFVKWIGDIRFPTADEEWLVSVTGTSNKQYFLRPMVLDFTVAYTQELADNDIQGFQIVYVERDETNSTIVDNGYAGSLEDESVNGYTFPTSMVNSSFPSGTDIYEFTGSIRGSTGGWTTSPVAPDTSFTLNADLLSNYKEYVSPDVNFGKDRVTMSADYLVGYREESLAISTFNPRSLNVDIQTEAADDSDRNLWSRHAYNYKMVKGDSTASGNISRKAIGDQTLFSDTSYAAADNGSAYGVSINGQTVINRSKGAGTAVGATYANEGARGTCIVMYATDNMQELTNNLLSTPAATGVANELVYCARKQSITPYGGLGYNARQSQTYIPLGRFKEFTNKTVGLAATSYTVGGDTYLGMFEHLRTMNSEFNEDIITECSALEIMYLVCESKYNMVLRNSYAAYKSNNYNSNTYVAIKETAGAWTVPGAGSQILYQNEDLYEYNDVYSRNANVKTFITEPSDFTPLSVFDARVLASERKIPNEINDSWSKFYFANQLDLESKYGPITRLHVVGDNLVALQEKGIAYLAVSEREQVVGESGFSLSLGTGGILTRHDYVNIDTGTSEYYASIVVPTGLYFFDSNLFTFNTLASKAEPSVERVLGMESYFNTQEDNSNFEFYSLGYDRNYKELYINFNTDTTDDGYLSLIYNDVDRVFSGFYDFTGDGVYLTNLINNGNLTYGVTTNVDGDLVFYTLNNDDSDEGVGTSNLTLLLNPFQGEVVRHDSLEWNSVVQTNSIIYMLDSYGNKVKDSYGNYIILYGSDTEDYSDTFDSVTITNEYQSTGTIAGTNFKRRFRNWRCNTIRDNVTNDPRIRSAFIKAVFPYTIGTSFHRLSIDSMKLYYQPNKR